VARLILSQIVELFVWLRDEIPADFADTFAKCLDPKIDYYINMQKAPYNTWTLMEHWRASPEHRAWVESLRAGDLIDTVRSKETYPTRNRRLAWRRARITSIDSLAQVIHAQYLHDIGDYQQFANV
jgi:hypothetical protein